jgi:hypothetical protein
MANAVCAQYQLKFPESVHLTESLEQRVVL